MTTTDIKLTQFSPGAGCGCKISPADLREIIKQVPDNAQFKNLLVGCETCDDAAVFDIGGGRAIISTTDFFTPIVDDPFDFGRIAAANAISDVYAMGGKPLMAISILGWPLSKLPADIAGKIIEGAVEVCRKAGIPLAGGHSIDISDPVFGLSVTGVIKKKNIKQNNLARPGCRLFLTKPLGIGILSTAAKKNVLEKNDYLHSVAWMTKLNSDGIDLGDMPGVRAMTDVTGFGLLGHLLEICEGSGLSARVSFNAIPKLDNINHYIELNCIPGGTYRNWKSYGNKIRGITEFTKLILADPQTSGGLLIAVDQNDPAFDDFAARNQYKQIGILEQRQMENLVWVEE
ncbi:MAG TPA: selenide, water dikinase SelD [Bacteroidales bacterium]|nr:selenide, water dikinase SelD [Bacteroidales bacterium]